MKTFYKTNDKKIHLHNWLIFNAFFFLKYQLAMQYYYNLDC